MRMRRCERCSCSFCPVRKQQRFCSREHRCEAYFIQRQQQLSQVKLKNLLDYDPVTGAFTWRARMNDKIRIGDRAGHLDRFNGYRVIGINGKCYRAARLAVFWMTGRWPSNTVDHINGTRDDDRWSNLRSATPSQNCRNSQKYQTANTLKGAYREKKTGRYFAAISINRKTVHLGTFATAEEAHATYINAAHKFFGEFARAK